MCNMSAGGVHSADGGLRLLGRAMGRARDYA